MVPQTKAAPTILSRLKPDHFSSTDTAWAKLR